MANASAFVHTGGVVETALQRVRACGVRTASIVDLLAIGFSRRAEDVELAKYSGVNLLRRFGSIRGLQDAPPVDVSKETGLEGYELLRCQVLIELGRRMEVSGKGPDDPIDGPEDILNYLGDLRYEKREFFVALLLDTKNVVLRRVDVHIGTLNASLVGAREVFREAIRDGASAIIVAHNHPSGDPTPSPEDIDVTRQLIAAGKVLDMPLLDHVIIGERRFVSLAREGHMHG